MLLQVMYNVNEISTLIKSYALERDTSSSFVFADPISRKLLHNSKSCGRDVAVLLSGPTGTGKEVMARVITNHPHVTKGRLLHSTVLHCLRIWPRICYLDMRKGPLLAHYHLKQVCLSKPKVEQYFWMK